MFRWLTKTKAGFTLVELMVVLVLLSLGFVALANITSTAYRAFEKSSERRIKQESVKNLAEILHKSTRVGSAHSADVFVDLSVVPTAVKTTTVQFDANGNPVEEIPANGEVDSEYSYLYAKYGVTPKGEGGYFLFHLKKGGAKAECLNPDQPLFIEFYPAKLTQKDLDTGKYPGANIQDNQAGVRVRIMALENEVLQDENGDPKQLEKVTRKNEADEYTCLNIDTDYIYYELDVTYHFPNMISSGTKLNVNFTAGGQKSQAPKYNTSGKLTDTYVKATGLAFVDGDDAGRLIPGYVFRCSADSLITGDSSNADVTSQSFCFIATASYGHDSGEVGLLCEFRDKCLLTNPLGTAFVKAYYKLSPPVADFIAQSEPLKAIVRLALKPLVIVATNALEEDVARQSAPWFFMFMFCGAGATVMLINVNKRKKKFDK